MLKGVHSMAFRRDRHVSGLKDTILSQAVKRISNIVLTIGRAMDGTVKQVAV